MQFKRANAAGDVRAPRTVCYAGVARATRPQASLIRLFPVRWVLSAGATIRSRLDPDSIAGGARSNNQLFDDLVM